MPELDMYGKPIVNDGPRGIGGWLILPLIGLIGTLGLTALNLFLAFRDIPAEAFRAIMEAATPELETVRLAVLLSLLSGFAILGTASRALYLFLKTRRSLPGSMIFHYLALMAALGAELYAAHLLEGLMPGEGGVDEAWKWFIRGLIGGAIWIAYFRMSDRVKNTFVN